MEQYISIIVITQSRSFLEASVNAFHGIKENMTNQFIVDSDFTFNINSSLNSPLYLETCDKANRFLSTQKQKINLLFIQAESPAEAERKVLRAKEEPNLENLQVGMVYYDHSSIAPEHQPSPEIDAELELFYQSLKTQGIPAYYAAYSTAAFIHPEPKPLSYQPMQYIECRLPDTEDVLQTELLCLWMDFFEKILANRRIKPTGEVQVNSLLGEQLVNFLGKNSGNDWLASYYTGSVVSSLIRYCEREAPGHGAMVLRGPSEHSLACGAMANWQLYKKPFAIIVTSGMIDEFKGTLTNLRECKAKGFIILAENRPSQWFPFQGTINVDEDTRDVLKARRIPHVYMEDVENFEADLQLAYQKYDAHQGPVVILATSQILESTKSLGYIMPEPENQSVTDYSIGIQTREALDQVMDLLNEGPEQILWQCGGLDREELELVHVIADRAGLALADSLSYPGSVPRYINGKRNPNYIGTLSIYGYSSRVYNFLYTNKKLNPKQEQCLFFIKSKISQVCSPIPEGRLDRQLNIVQVTHNESHIAPFTNVGVNMDSRKFLEYVAANLNVSEELRQRRIFLMNLVQDNPSDVLSKLPSTPMSPNYFYSELNQLVEKLIINEGYDYTGVYDVGRCGISAVRNVARTRRGFSGWYGRALMGDALLATISLAYTSDTNIMAFIGDGARGLVPDVLPAFIENALAHPGLMNKNVTIFYLNNGGHSVINTYQEFILSARTSRQMRLINLNQPDWESEFCGVKIVSKSINSFNPEQMEAALTEPGRLNLFSVPLAHNNEGDGLSLLAATGWQRDPVPARTLKTVSAV